MLKKVFETHIVLEILIKCLKKKKKLSNSAWGTVSPKNRKGGGDIVSMKIK